MPSYNKAIEAPAADACLRDAYLHDYRGGIKEWAEKGLPTEGEAAKN